jgi:DNA replication protein DnaC
MTTAPGLPAHLDADPVAVADNIREAQTRLSKAVPARFQDARPTEPQVNAWVADVLAGVSQPHFPVIRRGPSLLLLGPTGTGKTHQAYGALRSLALSGARFSWTFTTAADAYARLRPRPRIDPEETFLRLAGVSVLVLDDLGAAKATEWTEEVNYRLINHRYEHELATLITSNVPVGQLKTDLGDRVVSRLAEMATRAVLTGPDRRRLMSRGEQEA